MCNRILEMRIFELFVLERKMRMVKLPLAYNRIHMSERDEAIRSGL